MIKCPVDLKVIKSKTTQVAREALKLKKDIQEIQKDMKTLLKTISEEYDITDSAPMVDTIFSVITRYGITQQDTNFFNPENINNLLIGEVLNVQRVDTLSTSADQIVDQKQVRLRADANTQFLDDAYHTAREVRTYVEKVTNQNLFDALFINRGSINGELGTVKNNADLNNNVRTYQEQLFQNIINYLKFIINGLDQRTKTVIENKDLLENAVLYIQKGDRYVNPDYFEKVKDLIKAYLSPQSFNEDMLRDLFNKQNNVNLSTAERREASFKLTAYNSWIILNNFDSYLSSLLGKAIKIKDFNQLTGEDKYQISNSTANLATTWRTSDNIFVEDEADEVTKLAINTTPLYEWQSTVPEPSQFLYFSDFEHTIAKIKDLVYNINSNSIVFNEQFRTKEFPDLWNSLSTSTQEFLKDKSIRQAINYIRKNPRQYLHSIFELLCNDEFFEAYENTIYEDFTQDELNKLYTIGTRIFGPKTESSLYNLIHLDADNDYYSYITQSADSIFKIGYVQYYINQDGLLQVRTLIDSNVSNIRRGIEQTINVANSSKLTKDFKQWMSNLQMTINPEEDFKYIEYTIPNTTIRVRVIASSGNVSFTDQGKIVKNFDQLLQTEEIQNYIDEILRIGYTDNTLLQGYLKKVFGQNTDVCKDLLSFAARVTLNKYVGHEIVDKVDNILKEEIIKKYYGNNAPKYNWQLDELGMIHGSDIASLKKIARAVANVRGVSTSSIVRDGEGNAQSQQTLSRLLGSLQSQFDLQERADQSVTRDCVLLTVDGLFEGVFTAKEYHSDDENKAFTAMNPAEMTYASVISDYIGGLMSADSTDLVGNGHIMLLPSVNSDKSTIGRIRINLNKEVNGIPLKDYSTEQLQQLIASDISKIYINMFKKVTNDWNTIDLLIRENTNFKLPLLKDDFANGFSNFNESFYNNPILVNDYGNPVNFIKSVVLNYNKVHRLIPIELIDQVHYLEKKGTNKRIELGINNSFLAQIVRFNPTEALSLEIPKTYYNSDTKTEENYPSSNEFWRLKESEILKDLLKTKFKVNTTNNKQPEFAEIRDKYKSWVNSSGDLILAKTAKGDQITSTTDIIKLGFGEDVNEVIDNLSKSGQIILNPILSKYNLLDYLFTQEFMISTVGSFIAHPHKSKSGDVIIQEAGHFNAQHKRNVAMTAAMHAFQLNTLNGIPEDYNISVLSDIKDEQGTIGGDLNIIKPFDGATFVNPFVVILENYSLGGAKAGISKKQFVHFKNEKTGTGGIIKTAGFGLTNDWMRNSPFLQRMMKKMTDHVWLNEDGTVANIDITKSWRLNHNIEYKDIYYRENGKLYKLLKINKVEGKANTYTRTVQEISEAGVLGNIDEKESEKEYVINSNYKLWNFFGGMWSMKFDSKDKLVPSNTSVENVVIAMNSIGTRRVGTTAPIETQEQLWPPLKMVDVHYCPTAGAVKQGAANINSVDRYFDDEDYDIQRIHMYQSGIQLDKEHHADDAELSLMTQVISACAAKGYTFEAASLLYDAISKSTHTGLLDHITALSKYLKSKNIQELQEIVIKTIVDNLGNSKTNSGNFAQIIATDLIRKAKNGEKINYSEVSLPLSDNTVYAKIFSIITSYLTSSGIKYKIPGILSVLTPSYDINKIYAGRKYEAFQDPEKELNELQLQKLPTYDADNPDTNITDIELDRTYLFTYKNVYSRPLTSEEYDSGIEPEPLIITVDGKQYCLKGDAVIVDPMEYYDPVTGNYDDYGAIENADVIYDTLNNSYSITNKNVLLPLSKHIQNPRDYRELKKLAQEGYVQTVTEDVTVGRNLAAYNVRFKSLPETSNNQLGEEVIIPSKSFQLWDLDSIMMKFDINEIIEEKDYVKKIKSLHEFYKNYFNKDFTIDISPENINSFLITLRNRISRQIQSDLMNLSESSPNLALQYKQLLDQNNHTREYFDRYARWINIKLGRSDGNLLEVNGQLVKVTEQSFNDIEKIYRDKLAKTTKVKINGEYIKVDKSTLSKQAYEIIMPKTFATNFGLSEFDDINSISQDIDWFAYNQYVKRQRIKVDDNNNFTIVLKNTSNDKGHYYILDASQLNETKGLNKIPNILTVSIDGFTYRLDENGDTMYELNSDDEIYQDEDGNEIIVAKDISFYIENMHYDGLQMSHSLITKPSYVRELINNSKKSKKKKVNRWANYITSEGYNSVQIFTLNDKQIDTPEAYDALPDTHPVKRSCRTKHTSFLKALDIVAARIPSQSMQSFMPMKVVAFDNPDVNTAYVSTMQILLQGSDYDVDAVSLATFDIDRNGLLQLWSPYANIENELLLKESLKLPFPTGVEVKIEEVNDFKEPLNFFIKYRNLFTINKSYIWDKQSKSYIEDVNNLEVDMSIDSIEKLQLLREFLLEVKEFIQIPNGNNESEFINGLLRLGILTNPIRNKQQFNSIFARIKNIIDNHNLYFDSLSKYNISKIINNYQMNSMYEIILDPVNLIQAHTSVDGTTGPLKDVANQSSEAEEAKHRTPGNFVNKFESIVENQVGKEGISICAVGMKAFFALTQYNNTLLNRGTLEDQQRLLLGKQHRGIMIGNNIYKTIANIRALDPNTITNNDVLEALASVNNDNDASLILSALLSLATDNAKELALSKLNASTKMIGIYIYGITIGMDFKDIAKLLMSPVGTVFNEVANSNVFTGKKGYTKIDKNFFKYFEEGPYKILNQFNVNHEPNSTEIFKNPLDYLSAQVVDNLGYINEKNEPLSFSETLVMFSQSNELLNEKIKYFESLRLRYNTTSLYAKELYNQLIDFCEEYIQQGHTIGQNKEIYLQIKELSEGAAEQRVLGQILSINQGIKTSSDKLLTQINNIERCVYDKTENEGDIIDLIQFVSNKKYRDECIQKYEEVKHSFNILDAVSVVPHYFGYLKTLAIAKAELMQSFKFRSSQKSSLTLKTELNLYDESKLNKGLQNFIGDYMCKEWIKQYRYRYITIPKGNRAFNKNGDMFTLEEDIDVDMSTDWGRATFRLWFENEVIPNLKRGEVKPGIEYTAVSHNKFIRDLGNDLFTLTISHNPIIISTLPINMLPRIDAERQLFNSYKSEFNKLGIMYEYNTFSYNGEKLKTIKKQIPITDLFTLYAMVADNWKLGEKSLVPILEDFQNSGMIEDFHEFISKLDKSGKTLDISEYKDDVILYIAPFGNPYDSKQPLIQHRNPDSRKYQLMMRLSDGEIDALLQSSNGENIGLVGKYQFEREGVDPNLFPSGTIDIPTITRNFKLNDKKASVEYDLNDYSIIKIIYNGEAINIEGIDETKLFNKVDNGVQVNIEVLGELINNEINKC